MTTKILVVDDDTYICKLLVNHLNKNGFQADSAFLAKTGLDKIKKRKYDLILCDYRLPDSDGLKLLKKIKAHIPTIPVIIMTAYADINIAVKSIKSGAYDYVTKPVHHDEIIDLISEVTKKKNSKESSVTFKEEFITGTSNTFRKVMELVRIVAPVEMTVLIQGETGSGKEFIARLIHFNSKRHSKPFIPVDCGAISKGLANSELFGHLKGSFTGAIFDKIGVFEQANGGTLFLDEISNLSPENQMKFLRALQERNITRIGDTKSINLDLRIIVASNEDLFSEVKKNNLREDLYYRINEFEINVPALRDRKDDILIFADEMIKRASRRFNKEVKGYDERVRQIFLEYPWHGNIRELKNVINRAVLLAHTNVISIEDIPEEISNHQILYNKEKLKGKNSRKYQMDLKDITLEAEKEFIMNALIKSNYNKSETARMLKIDRKTLYNKIKQLNIPLRSQ